ncbi:6575_t:CDS:2 [Dentiscutata heterogama]|uniref:6575_t:CDS:1 n=1 Tax=Dentiscutata heterogama TaxID=1316150 RepID=A0ACA9KZN0_9GLOM|nr:6575_t:CDS:2 [Dentiscutata heterogama]
MNGHNEPTGDLRYIYYDEFQDIKPLNEGGFGKIFQATWVNGLGEKNIVALKHLKSSKDLSIDIVNEVIPFEITSSDDHILHYYGLTNNIYSHEILIVMEYAEGGDLFNFLAKKL